MALEDLLNRYYWPVVQNQIYGAREGTGVRAMTAGGPGGDAEQGDGGASLSMPDLGMGGGGVGGGGGAPPIAPGIGPIDGPGAEQFARDYFGSSSAGDVRGGEYDAINSQFSLAPGGFIDTSFLDLVASMAPGFLGQAAGVGGAAARDANLDYIDQVREWAGLDPMSDLERLSARYNPFDGTATGYSEGFGSIQGELGSSWDPARRGGLSANEIGAYMLNQRLRQAAAAGPPASSSQGDARGGNFGGSSFGAAGEFGSRGGFGPADPGYSGGGGFSIGEAANAPSSSSSYGGSSSQGDSRGSGSSHGGGRGGNRGSGISGGGFESGRGGGAANRR